MTEPDKREEDDTARHERHLARAREVKRQIDRWLFLLIFVDFTASIVLVFFIAMLLREYHTLVEVACSNNYILTGGTVDICTDYYPLPTSTPGPLPSSPPPLELLP